MPTVLPGGNANITWTDGAGAATLTATGGFFENWQPSALDVGETAVALGTGQTYKFIERTDYTCVFEIRYVPPNQIPLLVRLKLWLEKGGQITLHTQDFDSDLYTCLLAPGQLVSWTYDRVMREYTVTIPVLNTAANPFELLYTSASGQ